MSKRQPQDNGPVPQIIIGRIVHADCGACQGKRLTIRRTRTPCTACSGRGEVYANVEIVSVDEQGRARRQTIPRLVICHACKGAGGFYRSSFQVCPHCVAPTPEPLPQPLLQVFTRRESALTETVVELPRGFEHDVIQVGPDAFFDWMPTYDGVVLRDGASLDGVPDGAWVERGPKRPRVLLPGDKPDPWWRRVIASSEGWLR